MGVYEALRVLEIKELRGLTDKEVKRVYRNLMSKCHPDKGGDVGKAQMVNEAYSIVKEAIKKLKVSDSKNAMDVVMVSFGDLKDIYGGVEVQGRSDKGEIGVTRRNIRVLNTYLDIEVNVIIGSIVVRFDTVNKWNISDDYTIHGYIDCVSVSDVIDMVVKVYGKEIPVQLKEKVVIPLKFDSGIKLRIVLEKRIIKE